MQWQKQTTAKPSELPNVMPILWALPSFFRLVTFLLSHHHKLSTVLSPTRSLTETISPAESLQDKQERSTSKTCRKQNTTKNSKPLLLEKKKYRNSLDSNKQRPRGDTNSVCSSYRSTWQVGVWVGIFFNDDHGSNTYMTPCFSSAPKRKNKVPTISSLTRTSSFLCLFPPFPLV